MTKAVGPKHKPDLWKVRAKSQVFSTAGLSAPLSFSISFLSFMIPPSCLSLFPSSCLSLSPSKACLVSVRQIFFFFISKRRDKSAG